MQLTRVRCRTFRCLTDVEFEPGAGINVIRGKNAQGKTSVLEAILYAATSKSHRTNQDSELVQHEQDGFSLMLEGSSPAGSVQVDANFWQGAKRFRVNGVALERISSILGRIHVVFFSPEDLGLVKGSATLRRRFMDMELSQISPHYLVALQEYRNVLRQRNQLLRTVSGEPSALDEWDVLLARHGEVLMRERGEFVSQLSGYASHAYARIAEGETLRVDYAPDIASADGILSKLRESRDSDIRRQLTTHGPHRDDIDFHIQETPARSHASQGQQKTAALAVKLAEIELVIERTGEQPVLMLDEVLAELDDERARELFAAIPDGVQTLLTTTDVVGSRGIVSDDATSFEIDSGTLSLSTSGTSHRG